MKTTTGAQTDYEVVRDVCIAVNSELIPDAKYQGVRPIRLADVLLAIRHRFQFSSGIEYRTASIELVVPTFEGGYFKREERWNLHADDLSQQSSETLKFLASLLRV